MFEGQVPFIILVSSIWTDCDCKQAMNSISMGQGREVYVTRIEEVYVIRPGGLRDRARGLYEAVMTSSSMGQGRRLI